MESILNKTKLTAGFTFIMFALSFLGASPLPAQERYPAVARISFVSGPVTYSRGDDPDEWDDAVENVPLTIGDRIYAPEDGRAEVQLSSGNFVRLAPRSYFTTLNLSDDVKQFYLGEGVASFNIRRLQPDEVIEIDTPSVSVTLDEPGIYRVAVDDDGNSRITVRRGRVMVAASGRQIAVENSEIRVYGIDSPQYEIVGLPATDAFDRWVSDRDVRYDRSYSDAYRYASDDIIGVEDLAEYGRWEQIPEYGYAWTPTVVAAGWLPFSDGRWFWQDPWGWTWISNQRWGWATSHYGRWTPYRSRWYWVPVRPRTRVRYVPAVVEFVRVRDHVGWFPLHPRDRYVPWWDRRDRRNITYVNRTYVTVVNQNTFISARPVNRYIVRDAVIVRDASSGRFASGSLPIPTRSSLRVVSDTGERRGYKPSANVLNRAAVVRTAPPAPPPSFREKLPEIQKAQGKPIEPSKSSALVSPADKARPERVRIRPAAEETQGKELAPRNPGATPGPAPQPLTPARGKKLATRESPSATAASEKREQMETSPAPTPPAKSSPPAPSKGAEIRPEATKPPQERQRPDKQTLERPAQPVPQKPEVDRQLRQQEQDRKAQQLQQQKEQERREQLRQQQLKQQQEEKERGAQVPQERSSREQQRLEELERQGQQREEQRKAQLQQRQEQERREQARQQQLQERQAQQQKQQDLERRQQEQEPKARPQQQQEQARREQLRQQQSQERQAQQQRQQEAARRQQQQQEADRKAQAQQQQREQPPSVPVQKQAPVQQSNQQAQRAAQQAQRQQQVRQQQQQPQEGGPTQAAPRRPGQF